MIFNVFFFFLDLTDEILLGSCGERGRERGSQRHVIRPRRFFHNYEVNDLYDDQLIEQETSYSGKDEYDELK